MLCSHSSTVRVLSRVGLQNVAALSSSAVLRSSQPNPSVPLDPTLKTLLRGVDLSVSSHKKRTAGDVRSRPLRELEPFQNEQGDVTYHDMGDERSVSGDPALAREDRKSPAARFGSNGIGAVILPAELQRAIASLIDDSDKSQLHSDAKRLFLDEVGARSSWDMAYDVKYKSRKQSYRHATRDATAFASVILPLHYSAIFAVFHHLKHRLGPTWNVQRVIDWGAGTGSGLWAALSAFQRNLTFEDTGSLVSNSSITSYVGIDKRDGLVGIGKELLHRTGSGSLSVTWQKALHESDRIDRADGQNTVALSAFMLSSFPSQLSKKQMVKEMWESGAHTIVLVDFNTKAGFENIAEARQLLLDLGCKDLQDPRSQHFAFRGSHVVAPCPHDRPCPLYQPGASRLACGFSQRLQSPSFLRRTKHVKEGYEDIGYSYVVVQRGSRPNAMAEPAGRIGAVGKEAMEREVHARTAMLKELRQADEHQHDAQSASSVDIETENQKLQVQSGTLPVGANTVAPVSGQANVADVADVDAIDTATTTSFPHGDENVPMNPMRAQTSTADLEETLRREAYKWPRLVFPPLKKSGHIIIDACTAKGTIMRLTIPRSQGKQPFYDARKSSWGDLFPHPPKNKPVERFQSAQSDNRDGPVRGDDIGKRAKGRDKHGKVEGKSYEAVDAKIREEKRKASRRELATEKRLAQDLDIPC
ncbi:mitochondrial small ribosomal subunit Rsm22-domain-containing protein [Pisolithus marmoratus]|nr:mitochondrial small ribosomal subunit Rsm22-domain-containing protein [Pisolithus marmoratus]